MVCRGTAYRERSGSLPKEATGKESEDKTMCRKMKRTIIAMTCVIAMGFFNVVPALACTPPLNPPSVKIPDINFQPGGALEEAINNAVKNWLEKCILGTPTVNYATYFKSRSRYFNYAVFSANWNKVENATSYKVRVTKADGSYKEFDTTYTSFYAMNYTDEFFADGMDDATVMVRAYGENGTFSLWSKTTTITRFRY